jgi:hypothetical protein
MITFAKQSGHVAGPPSGVRDEIIISAAIIIASMNVFVNRLREEDHSYQLTW